VHLANFPGASDILGPSVPADDTKQREDWSTLLAVRTEVLKALEEARQSKLIGANLEAQVTITAGEPVYAVLKRYQDQLRYLFIVSAVTLAQGASGNGTSGVTVQVAKADGKKCERCWNYSIHVGEDAAYPTVCERCSAVLKEIGGQKATGTA
jgi:isoleucyl-tRNA synthetase